MKVCAHLFTPYTLSPNTPPPLPPIIMISRLSQPPISLGPSLTRTATLSLSTGRRIGRSPHSLGTPASLRQTTVTRASFVLVSHCFPSPGASTECATSIPNLSPDSMWSH
ncbi:hypothetical protein N7501_006701, partial [Penicillium viridicatum]